MAELLQITLTSTAADAKFGRNPTLTPTADGYQIHAANTLQPADALRLIQKAGRTLDGLGLAQVQLAGSNWTLDQQWAFYQGFSSAKKLGGVNWAGDNSQVEQLVQLQQCFAFAKRITNETPEDLSPEDLCSQAIEFITAVAGKDNVQAQVIAGDALLAAGWVGVHTVGRGSDRAPAILVLDYNPTADANAPVAASLVGKGITFDSGGYSIKASEGMVTMKCDMGGAATVTAALALAVMQGLNKRVQLVLCCAENLINGRAYKLGDIIRYKNGVSVEVVNTDAEGRLVLADGLQIAAASGAPLVIDAATLTGAAMMALGTEYNALFALDKSLQARALGYAQTVQEGAWALPLERWHQQQCPSAYADTANSRPIKGGGTGGASNAAGFLSRFVGHDGQGWLHVDLAAAFHGSANAFWGAGATGVGIRMIATTLLQETR
jgi:PepB aminopeptidase